MVIRKLITLNIWTLLWSERILRSHASFNPLNNFLRWVSSFPFYKWGRRITYTVTELPPRSKSPWTAWVRCDGWTQYVGLSTPSRKKMVQKHQMHSFFRGFTPMLAQRKLWDITTHRAGPGPGFWGKPHCAYSLALYPWASYLPCPYTLFSSSIKWE